jgi:hypothetical protein
MGRSEGDFKHLLDTNADQNIGNSTVLQPQAGSGGTVIPQTNPARLLQLTGPSQKGQTTSVVFTASRIVGADNPNPGYAGPVTGIVEFGNGARFTRVEFDVPLGPYVGLFTGANAATEPQDGGTVITVPTGVLRAYVRYDNLLIQPILGTIAESLASALGVTFVGPGGPVIGGPVPGGTEPILAKAMASYYTRHWAKLWKTNYLYIGAPGVLPQVIPGAEYCVPPFAKSVKVQRYNLTTSIMPSMTIVLLDNKNVLEQFVIAAGTSPTIELSGFETTILIQSTTTTGPNADAVTTLALCYEIGL